MRNLVLNPIGIVTRPNKYGQFPPGALSTGKNMCLRERGILSSLPGVRELTNGAMSSGSTVKRIVPIDTDRMLLAGNDRMRFIDGSSASAVTVPPEFEDSTWTFDTTHGTSHAARIRARTLVTSDQGVVAFDDAVSFTAPRAAGLPFPTIAVTSCTATDAQSLATTMSRAYRALLVRKFSDGYLETSEVSPPITLTNNHAATEDPTVRVFFRGSNYGMAAGDVVELYRTKDVAAVGSTGDRMFLCARYTLVAGDITNKFASIRDTTIDSNLSDEELYTNPAQEGLQNTNTPPPLAHDVCTFKGHTLYLSRELIPYFQFTIKGSFGSPLSSTIDRIYGIGARVLTVDTTDTSNQVINGSNMNGVVIGQKIVGTGIPADTRITAVSGTTITMSAAATATAAGVTVTITDVLEYGAGASDWVALGTPNEPIIEDLIVYSNTPRQYAISAATTVAIVSPDIGRTMVIRSQRYCNGTFTLRATNGGNYTPELPSTSSTAVPAITDSRANRFHTSKLDKPESVPVLRYQFVGAATGHRLIATKDTVYAFASDGLHRITGTDHPWSIDPVDRTLVLVDRLAVDVMDDVIYALTNRGLVAIVGDQVSELSREVIDLGVDGVEAEDGHTGTWMVACDAKHREVWMTNTVSGESTTYIFNVMTRSFMQFDPDELISRVVYHKALGSIVYTDSDTAPDVNYFRDDTDTTRLAGADVRFQPLTGEGDPFSQKEWQDVEFLFQGISSAATLVPTFDGTAYNARTVPANTIESRCKVDVPRNAPRVGQRIAPGFTLSAGGTAQIWSLRGMRARFEILAEQGLRR